MMVCNCGVWGLGWGLGTKGDGIWGVVSVGIWLGKRMVLNATLGVVSR
jgi:hypothetical protein